LTFATAAYAANTSLSNLSASGAIAAANLIYVVQTGGSGGVKATFTQVATFINSLFSGDATVAAGGGVTLATVNANVGSFGSATNCTTFTTNAKGLITAASQTACTPAIASITGLGTGVATALAVNVGTAGSVVVNGGALGTPSSGTLTNATGLPIAGITGLGTGVASGLAAAVNGSTGFIAALTPTNNNCVVGNGSAWTSTTCPGGGGGTGANPTATAGDVAVNGVATTFLRSDGAPAIQKGSSSLFGIVKVDNTSITASSGVISTVPISAVPSVQSGTNYAILDGDRAKVIYLSNASAQTPTLPSAATLTSSNGWFVTVCNIAAGIQTLTPTTSTIGGAATLAIPGGSAARPVCWNVVSDSTNYNLVPAGNNNTIASGTSAMGTSAIGSAACATVVTTSATGTATTDVVLASFNGDPTAVTGYVPLTAGMLTIVAYPTANNVNFKVCNNTSASITPGAITLNWRVTR
jgi:hypothetical protein